MIAICIGAAAVIGLLYYFVATAQQKQQVVIQNKAKDLFNTISQASTVLKTAPEVLATLEARKAELAKREAGLAADRDTYLWMMQTIMPFIQPRKNLNMPGVSQPVIGADSLVSRSPYKVAVFKMKGVGYYHDFGKFFADFENTFPYFRIQNWDMFPAGGGSGSDGEKINVSFDIVVPVRPAPEPAK